MLLEVETAKKPGKGCSKLFSVQDTSPSSIKLKTSFDEGEIEGGIVCQRTGNLMIIHACSDYSVFEVELHCAIASIK